MLTGYGSTRTTRGMAIGLLWMTASRALFQYDVNTKAWLDVTPDSSAFGEVEELAAAPDGSVWIVSRVDRWTLMRYRDGAWQDMQGGYDDESVFYALAASDDALYVHVGDGGVARCEVLLP